MDRPRGAQLCEANYLSVQSHFAVEITLPPNGYWVCTARVRVRAPGRGRDTHTHTRARGARGGPLCGAKALRGKAGLPLCLREGKAGKVCPELHLAALCCKGAATSPVQSLQRKGASGGAAQTWGFVA